MTIAEIGTSHGGSFDKARKLIEAAADAGCSAVKFQWVYADEILHPRSGVVNLPSGPVKLYEKFKSLEVPPSFYASAKSFAREKNLKFICSPFGLRSLAELLAMAPDAVKIASPELNHFPMLKALSDFRAAQKARGEKCVPVIVSCGVSEMRDIEKALGVLGKEGVTLLQCVTCYPAPVEESNVRAVKTLREEFGVETGMSDHSEDPVLVPSLAAAMGATVIEKHIALSNSDGGLDDKIALNPERFALMVRALRQCGAAIERYGAEKGAEEIIAQMRGEYGGEKVDAALGSGVKTLAPSERESYRGTNRSLFYMRGMKAGQKIKEGDVAVLRGEKNLSPGVSPEFLEKVMGATLSRDVEDGGGVSMEDFEGGAK